MARTLSPAMRERARFVGAYVHQHRGERPVDELMREAQDAFRHRSVQRNPSPTIPGWLVLAGVVGVGYLWLRGHSAQNVAAQSAAPSAAGASTPPAPSTTPPGWICQQNANGSQTCCPSCMYSTPPCGLPCRVMAG
jgi:hypothetical protein